MPEMDNKSTVKQKSSRVSLDAWAVALALVAVLLVRFGVIQKITW